MILSLVRPTGFYDHVHANREVSHGVGRCAGAPIARRAACAVSRGARPDSEVLRTRDRYRRVRWRLPIRHRRIASSIQKLRLVAQYPGSVSGGRLTAYRDVRTAFQTPGVMPTGA